MHPPRSGTGQRGFTLLELLATIAILGVLSGVAAFGVGALTNNAQGAACDIEARTIATAQEAHKARDGAYGDLDAIVGAGLVSERPELHDVQLVPGGWQLVARGACAAGQDEFATARDVRGGEVPADERPADSADELEERRAAETPQHILRLHRGPGPGPSSCSPGRVDLNRAGVEELARIAHVNPGRAIQIERGRPFSSVKDLQRIDGFDERRVEEILLEGLACV